MEEGIGSIRDIDQVRCEYELIGNGGIDIRLHCNIRIIYV